MRKGAKRGHNRPPRSSPALLFHSRIPISLCYLCTFQTWVRGCEDGGELWDRRCFAGWLACSSDLEGLCIGQMPSCLWNACPVPGMNNALPDFMLLLLSPCFNSISYTLFVLGPWLRLGSLPWCLSTWTTRNPVSLLCSTVEVWALL